MKRLAVAISLVLCGCSPPTAEKRTSTGATAETPAAGVGAPGSSVKASAAALPKEGQWAEPVVEAGLREEIRKLKQENQALRERWYQKKETRETAESKAKPPPALIPPMEVGIPEPVKPYRPSGMPPDFPDRGSPLTRLQRDQLLSGTIHFQPGSIPSSERPVDDRTPLAIGQNVQLKWNTTWWAATIVGFENDGAVRVHYFGWEPRHDEAVPRSDLQLDNNPRETAVNAAYPP